MSRDIRSFFSVVSNKSKTAIPTNNAPATKPTEHVSKRKVLQLSSDDEVNDDQDVKHIKKQKDNKNTFKKRRISDSDDEDSKLNNQSESKNQSKPNLGTLKKKLNEKNDKISMKAVNITDVFSNEPVKRIEKPKPPPPIDNRNKKSVLNVFNDDYDDDIFNSNDIIEIEKKFTESTRQQSINTSSDEKNKTPNKKKTTNSTKDETSPRYSKEIITSNEKKFDKEVMSNKKVDEKSSQELKHLNKSSDNVERLQEKHTIQPIVATPTSSKKDKSTKKEYVDQGAEYDLERQEKRRIAAILYQKHKNRSGPINPGCKEIPKGKPNCLKGLTFVISGVLESLDRDEAQKLIVDYGGKVTVVISKKTRYLVVGEDAGPKKLATANEYGVKILSEDDLLDMIRQSAKTDEDNSKLIRNEQKEIDSKKQVEKRKINGGGNSDVSPIKTPKIISPIKTEKQKTIHETASTSSSSTYVNGHSESKKSCMESLPWVEKYKPETVKQIIGQQGAASNCVKLTNWLQKWYVNHNGKTKLQKPNPWAKNDDGAYFKAALLSGQPGVGKTTTATLVCQELGFDIVELNASDTRSKKSLVDVVSQLLKNQSLYGYCHGDKIAFSKKHVLLMDEVDGMAGNEDRGGVQELISLIKQTSIPIICMCNDRNHQKMRSLVNYCYDLKFQKPRLEQIKGAMLSICFKERIKLSPQQIEEIILATNNDIRQTLNHLSLIGAKPIAAGNDDKSKTNETAKKDLKLGPWEVVRKVFSAEEHKTMTLNDKSDLYFMDYSLGPLFVQQNYLIVSPKVPKEDVPKQVALTADILSVSDLIDNRIRSNMAWSLLPVQAMFSSVMPGEFMSGHFTGQINFPGWLGKNSKTNKRNRLAQELHDHTRIRTSGSRLSIRLDYAPFLLNKILRPLKESGIDGVPESLAVIKEYQLLREDIDALIEISLWPGMKNPMDSIEGKVKAALTRAYNKEISPYTYSVMSAIKKKRSAGDDELNDLDMDENGDTTTVINNNSDSDELDGDNINDDVLIKAKKPSAKSSTKSSSDKQAKSSNKKSSTPSTSSSAGQKGRTKKN